MVHCFDSAESPKWEGNVRALWQQWNSVLRPGSQEVLPGKMPVEQIRLAVYRVGMGW